MDRVDASAHYTQAADEDKSSLLVLIIDTNPFAWANLGELLPLSKALANILVFLNAHLAFSHSNRVAVIASHTDRATFLYPPPPVVHAGKLAQPSHQTQSDADPYRDANKYRQFRVVEDEVQKRFRELMDSTDPESMIGKDDSLMAGALTLAMAYTNRMCKSQADDAAIGRAGEAGRGEAKNMNARVLVLSVSEDLQMQYIAIMNSIFAAQRQKIPIDVCKIAGDTVFLQQASDATKGIYMHLEHPGSLLQYLMMCFIPDNAARRHLVPSTSTSIDFRAACFCHKRVVDLGFVCSICLSSSCPLSVLMHKYKSYTAAVRAAKESVFCEAMERLRKNGKRREAELHELEYFSSWELSGDEDISRTRERLVSWWKDTWDLSGSQFNLTGFLNKKEMEMEQLRQNLLFSTRRCNLYNLQYETRCLCSWKLRWKTSRRVGKEEERSKETETAKAKLHW